MLNSVSKDFAPAITNFNDTQQPQNSWRMCDFHVRFHFQLIRINLDKWISLHPQERVTLKLTLKLQNCLNVPGIAIGKWQKTLLTE